MKNEFLDNLWLGLGDTTNIKVDNPFDYMTREDMEFPQVFVAKLFRNPDYFWFFAKFLLNIELHPFQQVILKQLWNHTFPMLIATRGGSKTFCLAVYCFLKAIINHPIKVVVVGASFRQAKFVIQEMVTIWNRSAVLRDICNPSHFGIRQGPRLNPDRYEFHIGESKVTALPLGDGTTIRGERANVVIADEFASIPRDVFEVVVRGFTSTSSSPIEKVKYMAKIQYLKKHKMLDENYQVRWNNQVVVAGTADWFNSHFYEYWTNWREIIMSRGDKQRIELAFGPEVVDQIDWKNLCIIRIPAELLPKGFLQEEQLALAKATTHTGIYNSEYGACFIKDTEGFFKHSLVESCVTDSTSVKITGDKNKRYVYGIDPASERDNFSIVILELDRHIRKVVYCWTTNRGKHKLARRDEKNLIELDFYKYCARKIRKLMRRFPCERIAIDTQGGGIAVIEALHDPAIMEEDEHLIWPIVEDKEKDTDIYQGLHIIQEISFSSAQWTSYANHSLKKDLEDKLVQFPLIDAVTLAKIESKTNEFTDSLVECAFEIEELKRELKMIVYTKTDIIQRERWDVPQVGGSKVKIRKDRYTALLMANATARDLVMPSFEQERTHLGGLVGKLGKVSSSDQMYSGPDWFCEEVKKVPIYGMSVTRD